MKLYFGDVDRVFSKVEGYHNRIFVFKESSFNLQFWCYFPLEKGMFYVDKIKPEKLLKMVKI